jgi:integrase
MYGVIMKHINRINNEITNINKGNKIKVRLRETKSGFSMYLDLFSRGKRQRTWLEYRLSGKESDWQEDKGKLLYAKLLRNNKEKDIYQNHHNFKLIDKSDAIIFVDYYIKISETKNKVNKTHWKSSFKWFKQFLKECGYSESLTLADIEREKKITSDYANFLIKQSIKDITANGYFKIYTALLNNAVKDELISRNPAKHVSIKVEESKKDYLTLDELRLLKITECPNRQIRNAFLFSCYTGLRLSDIMNLKFSDIEKITKTNEIDYTKIDVTDKQINIKMQKTKKFVTIPIINIAMEIINEQREVQENVNIFSLPNKNLLGVNLKTWFVKTGIKKKITFHSSRHTFATLLITSGVDIYIVSKLCGHSSVRITESAYANLIDSKRFNEMQKFSNLFNQ